MKKVVLYSRSPRSRRNSGGLDQPVPGTGDPEADAAADEHAAQARANEATERTTKDANNRSRPGLDAMPAGRTENSTAYHGENQSAVPRSRGARASAFLRRHERLLIVLASVLLSLGAFFAWQQWLLDAPRKLTQKDIDQAVLHTLDTHVLPSPEAKAFEAVRRSVVRVRQFGHRGSDKDERLTGVGTGVVIVDQGTILTNLHVVEGAERVQVVFWDGTVSEAAVTARQPENDLAVVQARTLPDDLTAATLRSTSDLSLGDKVVAVGFPFGIGPSVSSGVISGLRREYSSPDGEKVLHNLIQFDAAANPGNSGGPLVTMDGAVVGIVTAILNPLDQGVFIGIGFAVPIENAAAAAGESPF